MNYLRDIFKIIKLSKLMIISSFLAIALFLVTKYYLNGLIFFSINGEIFIIGILGLIIFINIIIYLSVNLHRNRSVHYLDTYFFIFFLSTVLVNSAILIDIEVYNRNLTLIYQSLSLASFIILIARIFKTSKREKYGNLTDLKDLYEGNFDKFNDRKIIVMEEKEVEYDLLNRTNILQQLFETIQSLSPQTKLVIGLEGEWGSGKSTLINLVKNSIIEDKIAKNSCIVIDDFDPWHYNDEKSMLRAMLESILNSVKIGLPSSKTRMIIKKFLNNIFEKKGLYLFDELPKIDDDINVFELTKIIDSYLKDNGKKIVFFIDNVDRTQKEHIFFIYKSIASLIKVKHIVYVIAYDPVIVSSAFTDMKIDDKYLDKIIQIKYSLSIDKNIFSKVKVKSLINFFKFYKTEIIKTYDESELLSMVDNFTNLREFKLFLNKLSIAMNTSMSYLNKADIVKILIIKTNYPILFNLIKDNYQYFITEGLNDNVELSVKRIAGDSFEKEAKQFFDKHSALAYWKTNKRLLEELFPVVKNYNRNVSKLYSSGTYDNNKSTLERRVSNAKYFPLYFNDSINNFIVIDRLVDLFIENMSDVNYQKKELEFVDSVLGLDYYSQILFFENLYMHVEQNEISGIKNITKFIIKIIYDLDDSYQGFSFRLNARTRAIALIAKLFFKYNINEYEEEIKVLKNNPKNVYLIRNLRYWLSPETEKINNYNEEKYLKIDAIYRSLLNDIFTNSIDLYIPEYYARYNGRCIEWNIGDENKIKEYYAKIIKPENVCKFLYDFMQVSSSSEGYGYLLDTTSVYKYLSEQKVDSFIEIGANGEDDLFVKEVYLKSKGKSINGFESAILRKEDVQLYRNN
jgi:hypothetical protein